MEIRKAIIPAAGWGTRRLPITKVIEKSMLPIGNRPIVDYIVEDCVKAGIRDIYIVVDSSSQRSQIESYYKNNHALSRYLIARGKEDKLPLLITKPTGVNIQFIPQRDDHRYGTAIPVAQVVEEFKIDETVAVLMGDDFIWNAEGGSELANLAKLIKSPEDSALIGVGVEPNEVSKYGVLKVEDEYLTDLVEKPAVGEAPSNLVNVSKYIMSATLLQRIVEYVREKHFGPRDQEYLITDPILSHMRDGAPIKVLPATGEYLDGGSVEGWLYANNVVLHSSKNA